MQRDILVLLMRAEGHAGCQPGLSDLLTSYLSHCPSSHTSSVEVRYKKHTEGDSLEERDH